jgi:hypothetical protein
MRPDPTNALAEAMIAGLSALQADRAAKNSYLVAKNGVLELELRHAPSPVSRPTRRTSKKWVKDRKVRGMLPTRVNQAGNRVLEPRTLSLSPNTTPCEEGESDAPECIERDRRNEPSQRTEQDPLIDDSCDESDDDAQQAQQVEHAVPPSHRTLRLRAIQRQRMNPRQIRNSIGL